MLDCAVPLRISHLQQHGGPKTLDFARARNAAESVAAHSDDVLFGGGSVEDTVVELIAAIAVMAFVPGGIKVFGRHWEA